MQLPMVNIVSDVFFSNKNSHLSVGSIYIVSFRNCQIGKFVNFVVSESEPILKIDWFVFYIGILIINDINIKFIFFAFILYFGRII